MTVTDNVCEIITTEGAIDSTIRNNQDGDLCWIVLMEKYQVCKIKP